MRRQYGTFYTFPANITDEELIDELPYRIQEILSELKEIGGTIDLGTLNIIFRSVINYGLPIDALREKATIAVKAYIEQEDNDERETIAESGEQTT